MLVPVTYEDCYYMYLQISACVRKIGQVSQELKTSFSNPNFKFVILLEDLNFWESTNMQQLLQQETLANHSKLLHACLTFYNTAVLKSLKNVYNVDPDLGNLFTTLTDPSELALSCVRFNARTPSGDPQCELNTYKAVNYANILENSFYTNCTTSSSAGYCKIFCPVTTNEISLSHEEISDCIVLRQDVAHSSFSNFFLSSRVSHRSSCYTR